MRSIVVYCFGSGLAFFIGAGAIFVATLLGSWPGRRVVAVARRVLLGLGVGFVALSGTPLPWWVYGVWGAILAAWLAAARVCAGSRPPAAVLAGLVASLMCMLAVAMELPWHVAPAMGAGRSRRVYVIGDSLSAGLDPSHRTPWPEVMARQFGAKVVNLARGGATAKSAMAQVAGVGDGDAVVVIEIGGNDLLGSTAPAQFEVDLERLIRRLDRPGRTLVMFELPSLPLRNAFGLAQRRVATAHDVRMIPRRCLAGVLTTPGATVDGIHLSEAGHRQLAERVWRVLR